jgi:Selenocysteine lyase
VGIVAAVQGAAVRRPADRPPLRDGHARARAARRVRAAVEYLDGVGWEFVAEHEGALGQLFLDGLPEEWTLHGIPTMDGRVPTFAITHSSLSPSAASEALGERGFATWYGNYYAVEIMRRLGLPDGAVRVGILHYNTEAEVQGLLAALAELS